MAESYPMDLSAHLTHPVFQVIATVARTEHMEAYVVGGFVRDLLLRGVEGTGKDKAGEGGGNQQVEETVPEDPSVRQDIDIVVVGSGIRMAEAVREQLRGNVPLSVFRNFGTAMLRWKDLEIEFVGARKESYRRNSRKPLVENGSLEDDQRRRDFTINALAISLHPDTYGLLLDPFDGLRDLERRVIRTPLDPGRTFSDDPLRMLRGIRFAARLGFRIQPETLDVVASHRERIRIVSQERITDELNKILMTGSPARGLRLLDRTGLLEIILPELHEMKGVEEVEGKAHKDNFHHTLEVLQNIVPHTDNLWLRWTALLHDVAKPRTRKFEEGTGWTFHGHEFIGSKMIPVLFKRLKLPLNDKMKYVQKLVRLHLRPIVLSQDEVTDSAVRRLIFDAGDDLEDLMTLCEADITSKNERTVRRHLKNFHTVRKKIGEIEEKDSIRNFQPPVTGDHIQQVFGIPPSRPVGIIKNAVKDAILDGEIPNEFEAAYQKMLQEGRALGLTVRRDLKKEES